MSNVNLVSITKPSQLDITPEELLVLALLIGLHVLEVLIVACSLGFVYATYNVVKMVLQDIGL